MRHPYRTAAVAFAAVVLLTGCSWSCTFDLLLTVTNADDGNPVSDVSAVLDTSPGHADERKNDPDAGDQLGTTNADGKLAHDFTISGYTSSDGPWYLKLRKEGFEPVILDISPRKTAKKGRELNPLPVAIRMKPLAK
jgi:hypothetical protein